MKGYRYYECEICGHTAKDLDEVQTCEDSHKGPEDLLIANVVYANGRSNPCVTNGPRGYPAVIEVTGTDPTVVYDYDVAVYRFFGIKSEDTKAPA